MIGRIAGRLRHEQGTEPRNVWAGQSRFGECPVWDDRLDRLYWVDIPTGILRAYDWHSGNTSEWQLQAPSAGLVLALETHLLLVGHGTELHQFDPATGVAEFFEVLPDARGGERINDLKYDRNGALWVATMDSAGTAPTGRLLRRSRAGEWRIMLQDLPILNGPAFGDDGQIGYVCDTVGRHILKFEVPSETPSETPSELRSGVLETEVFTTLVGPDGFPDGITVDDEHHLWLAHYAGGCVTRWSPDARCVARMTLPAHNITSVAPCSHGLFITSAAREGKGKQDAGGALFLYELKS